MIRGPRIPQNTLLLPHTTTTINGGNTTRLHVKPIMEDLLHLHHPFLSFAPINRRLRRHCRIPLAATVSPPPPLLHLTSTTESSFQERSLLLHSIGLDLLTSPSAIHATPTSTLRSTLHLLRSLGLPSPEIRRAVTICPEILSSGVPSIASAVAFLLREVGVDPHSLPRVIHKRPRLLASDVASRLRPSLLFLHSLGIHDVSPHADLLGRDVDDCLRPRLDFLKGVGFSPRDANYIARRFPDIFRFNVKCNLEPKFDFFAFEMGRDLRELKEFPEYFSYSLDGRIRPRHHLCIDKGVVLPLRAMLRLKDEAFSTRLTTCTSSSLPRQSSPLWKIIG